MTMKAGLPWPMVGPKRNAGIFGAKSLDLGGTDRVFAGCTKSSDAEQSQEDLHQARALHDLKLRFDAYGSPEGRAARDEERA